MIYDNRWKKDLIKIRKQLKFVSKFNNTLLKDSNEHVINRCFLFSVIIIRKIIEDEAELYDDIKEGILPETYLPILSFKVRVLKYKHDNNNIVLNSKFFSEDYTFEEEKEFELKYICNQIIHSYVWSVVYVKGDNNTYGVIFSSDKEKEKHAYLVTIDEWIRTLTFVINNCRI